MSESWQDMNRSSHHLGIRLHFSVLDRCMLLLFRTIASWFSGEFWTQLFMREIVQPESMHSPQISSPWFSCWVSSAWADETRRNIFAGHVRAMVLTEKSVRDQRKSKTSWECVPSQYSITWKNARGKGDRTLKWDFRWTIGRFGSLNDFSLV